MKIGIVAGEASGDLLGAHLVNALKQRFPEAEFVGIGGPKMGAAGVNSLFPMEKLAVRGYIEVLRHYREIVSIRSKVRQYFIKNPPDVFIGVDAPDFNLDLEIALKKRGISTIHYVSPSIWAWRGERIRKIARAVSQVLVLFPFEKKIYDAAGIPASYVGHPLADILPELPNRKAAREQLRLPQNAKVIAMLPGSRQSELQYMAKLFVQTAKKIAESTPNVSFLVPLVSRETRNLFETEMYRAGGGELPITVLFGHAHVAMVAADAVLVASGTATLEAALLKCPMVVTYRMSPITWRMMMRRKYLPYVGLPNILAGRFVVPELLQSDATAENLSQAIMNLVNDRSTTDKLAHTFSRMHLELKQNTAERAVDAILPYLSHG